MQAIIDLTQNLQMDVTTEREAVVTPFAEDTAQFIKAVVPDSAQPPSGIDGMDQTHFRGVDAGTLVTFNVDFYNDLFEPTTETATIFQALICVVGAGSQLSSREVYLIVPGRNGEIIVNEPPAALGVPARVATNLGMTIREVHVMYRQSVKERMKAVAVPAPCQRGRVRWGPRRGAVKDLYEASASLTPGAPTLRAGTPR